MPKVMISAGEASGDLHGASLAGALNDMQPDIELFGMGVVRSNQLRVGDHLGSYLQAGSADGDLMHGNMKRK